MVEDARRQSVIIDNGSFSIKAGLAGEDAPSVIFPSIVGQPISGTAVNDSYIGNEAQRIRDILMLSCPIRHGLIIDWDDIEKVTTMRIYIISWPSLRLR